MRKPFQVLVFVLLLALAYATAQTSSPSANTKTNDPTSTPSQPSQDQTQKPEAQSGVAATATSSTDVQGQIQNALKNEPTLSNDSINVSVTDDMIELNGTVATAKEKETAKRIAQSYAGNRKVKEHLTVGGQADNKGPDSNPPSSTLPETAKPPRR